MNVFKIFFFSSMIYSFWHFNIEWQCWMPKGVKSSHTHTHTHINIIFFFFGNLKCRNFMTIIGSDLIITSYKWWYRFLFVNPIIIVIISDTMKKRKIFFSICFEPFCKLFVHHYHYIKFFFEVSSDNDSICNGGCGGLVYDHNQITIYISCGFFFLSLSLYYFLSSSFFSWIWGQFKYWPKKNKTKLDFRLFRDSFFPCDLVYIHNLWCI